MATRLKNLSATTLKHSDEFRKVHIAIVVAEWNKEITHALMKGAVGFLIEKGVKERNIHIHQVPGSFELPFGAQLCAEQKKTDAVITLGCVIQGETRHFDFICDACANGVMQAGLNTGKPVVFGVLTTDNEKQARERAGGKHGNKGVEAAETALKMLSLQRSVAR